MVVLPVMERELRTCARQPFTYTLRSLGMVVLLLQCLIFGSQHGFGPTLGSKLFSSLHYTLFGAIWILVPLLTADCISRERREGTLGLLFLTRLSATDIVTAKSLAQGLRALTLWLAVVPVLTIPFILGGVSWIQALLSVAISFSSICWALAAGLVASACSKSWLRAVMGAVLLSACFVMIFGMILGEAMLSGTGGLLRPSLWQSRSDFIFLTGFAFVGGGGGYLRFLSLSTGQILWTMSLLASFSVLLLLLAIALAGRNTSRVWREEPPSKLQVWCERTFFTPRFLLSFFRRWMLRQIERNPIGWLERRRWSGRLVTWAWFAVVITVYSTALGDRHLFRGLYFLQNAIGWLLAGSIAISAAGSFRRERETGVLELLLVSPLKEGQIISGRLRGLWGQFLPAFGLLFALWIYFNSLFGEPGLDGIVFHLGTFLALPVIGLYFSLRCRNFMAAFLLTLVSGLFLPILMTGQSFPAAACVQILIAYFFAEALYRNLKKRAFRFTQESRM
jgi:ABC-type transport system involved in multi-copper enzyme maturation permease subunit